MPNLVLSYRCVTVNNRVTKELPENVYVLDVSGMLLCARLLCYCLLLKMMTKELLDTQYSFLQCCMLPSTRLVLLFKCSLPGMRLSPLGVLLCSLARAIRLEPSAHLRGDPE